MIVLGARSVAWFNTSPCHGEDRQFKSGRARSLRITGLLTVLTAVLAAAPPVGDSYDLGLLVDQFTIALVNNDARGIYRLFVPSFTDEVSYARFESTFADWQGGRRLTRARSRIGDLQGLGGHVSTYVIFAGEEDYSYLYSSWINIAGNWQLTWLSNILDPQFRYGHADSTGALAAAAAALRFCFSDSLPPRLRRELPLPDTVFLVDRGIRPELAELGGRPVRWVPAAEVRAGTAPPARYYCLIQFVRLFGDIAQVTIDYLPGQTLGRQSRRPGIEVYLRRTAEGWRFHSVGKLF